VRAFAIVVLASASLAAAADPGNSAALEQYRKLRCEPRSLSVQSVEPLRFAATATCYKLPKSFAHDGWVQLVAVDVGAGTVRLVDLGRDNDAARTLQHDGHGGLRWIARRRPHADQSRELEVWTLAASETQPRLTGQLELPFDVGNGLDATRGTQCMLIGGSPQNHVLVKFIDGGLSVQPVAGLRGVRLWHSAHQAFVVQTDPESLAVHALLDCDGQTRPLPEGDAARFAEFPREQILISSRSDWLVRIESSEGEGTELVIFQGDSRRSFGPFEWMPKGCPDICVAEGLQLMDPGWSPGGGVFIAHEFFEAMIVSGEKLTRIASWNYRDNGAANHTALLSDSLAMQLSKKRGVIFHRW